MATMANVSLLRLSLQPPPKPYLAAASFSRSSNFSTYNRNRIALPPPPPLRRRQLGGGSVTCMSYSPTPAVDRLVSAVAYTLPLFNSLQYGRFLVLKYPSLLGVVFDPLLPLLSLYKSVPYASFVAFFGLYLGVVRNPSFSHYVRFNSMQAVTLDVLLVLPMLLQRILNPGRAGLGFRIMVWGHNVVFVFSVMCFLYSLASTILGRTPYLPFVADAAGRQL